MNGNNVSPTTTGTVINKKKKRKFNVIDFFILLLIIVIIGAVIYAFSPWSQIKKLWSTDEITFQYAVELKNVDAQFIQLIQSGDSVVNSISKNSLGTVTNIDASQKSYELHYKEGVDGTVQGVLIESADKYDIVVYITTTAQYEKDVGYTVNGTRVAVGEELALRFPQYAQNGYCISIATDS